MYAYAICTLTTSEKINFAYAELEGLCKNLIPVISCATVGTCSNDVTCTVYFQRSMLICKAYIHYRFLIDIIKMLVLSYLQYIGLIMLDQKRCLSINFAFNGLYGYQLRQSQWCPSISSVPTALKLRNAPV